MQGSNQEYSRGKRAAKDGPGMGSSRDALHDQPFCHCRDTKATRPGRLVREENGAGDVAAGHHLPPFVAVFEYFSFSLVFL